MPKKLGFTTTKFQSVSVRDYGLIRVSKGEGASTPYPRSAKPVDNATIRDRLLEEQSRMLNLDKELATKSNSQHIMERTPQQASISASIDSIESSKDIKKLFTGKRNVTVVSRMNGSSTRSSLTQQFLSFGTPHPIKKIALNPQILINRLSHHTLTRTSSIPSEFVSKKIGVTGSLGSKTETTDSEEFLNSYKINNKYSENNLRSYSSIVDKDLKPILKKGSVNLEEPQALKCVKKVKLIVPKTTWTETMPNQNAKVSFAERRRLHDEAEFTICKNGVPLNDIVMGFPDDPKFITDDNSSDQDEALLKLTKFMREEGIFSSSGYRVSL